VTGFTILEIELALAGAHLLDLSRAWYSAIRSCRMKVSDRPKLERTLYGGLDNRVSHTAAATDCMIDKN